MDFLPCKNETYLFVGPPWFHRGQTERVHFLGNLQACNLHFWRHLKTISRMVQLVPHRLKQFWILENQSLSSMSREARWAVGGSAVVLIFSGSFVWLLVGLDRFCYIINCWYMYSCRGVPPDTSMVEFSLPCWWGVENTLHICMKANPLNIFTQPQVAQTYKSCCPLFNANFRLTFQHSSKYYSWLLTYT